MREVEALAREHGPEAIEVLARLMREGEGVVAVRAAVAILDRAYGRPPVEVAATVEDVTPPPPMDLSRLTDDEIATFIALLKKVRSATETGDESAASGQSETADDGDPQ